MVDAALHGIAGSERGAVVLENRDILALVSP
jgi:hypothetical protein